MILLELRLHVYCIAQHILGRSHYKTTYSAWSIGRLYCLIIVTRKAVISYRAKVSWIRTNRRQAEMFSVEETTAYTALSLLAIVAD